MFDVGGEFQIGPGFAASVIVGHHNGAATSQGALEVGLLAGRMEYLRPQESQRQLNGQGVECGVGRF